MKRVMVSVLCLLLLLAAVGAALYFYPTIRDKLFPEEEPVFSVTYGGVELEQVKGTVYCSPAEPMTFKPNRECEVTVKVNPNEDFVFTVSGLQYHFKDLDVSSAFDIKTGTDGTVTVAPQCDLAGIIAKAKGCDVSAVKVPNVDVDADFFIVCFTSGDAVKTFSFGLLTYDVSGVTLSDKELKF